ncbi:hypothetical protein D9M72_607350 [compost metagenome]
MQLVLLGDVGNDRVEVGVLPFPAGFLLENQAVAVARHRAGLDGVPEHGRHSAVCLLGVDEGDGGHCGTWL